MNDLQQIWKSFDSDTKTVISDDTIKKSINTKSIGMMNSIIKKVLTKFYWCLLFTILIGIAIPFVQPISGQILLLIMFAAYVVGDVLLYLEYQELKKFVDMSLDLQSGLREFEKRVKKVLKYEELIGLAIYPISVTAGFLIGFAASAEPDEFMSEPKDWIALMVVIGLMVPGANWLAKWMNKKAFGKVLEQLQSNIIEIERVER